MERQVRLALGILILLLMSPWSSMVGPEDEATENLEDARNVEFFSIRTDAYSDFVGTYDTSVVQEHRPILANTRIGVFSSDGLELNRPLSSEVLEPRIDVQLILIDNDRHMLDVRSDLSEIAGLEVREFIAPSGLMVQGTSGAFQAVQAVPSVVSQWDVPLAMFLDDTLLDALLFEGGVKALMDEEVRLEGWWEDHQTEMSCLSILKQIPFNNILRTSPLLHSIMLYISIRDNIEANCRQMPFLTLYVNPL